MTHFFEKLPIKWRLSLGYTIIMGVLFSLLGAGIYRLVKVNLYRSVDAALLTSAQAISQSRQLRQNMSPPILENFLTQFLGERSIRLYATLIDVSSQHGPAKSQSVHVRLKTTPQSIQRARTGLATYEVYRIDRHSPIRQITYPAMKGGRFTGEIIQVGAPLAPILTTLKSLNLVLWIVFPIALLLSVLCGYWLTRRSIWPVHKITQAASKIHIDDLSNRLPLPPANDELRQLTETFNSMLDRLEDSFKRHKRFTGDVSHELRTSLAVLRGEAQLALRRERDGLYYKDALGTILEESTHMSKIVEDLLLLSRAQSNSVVMRWEAIYTHEFMSELRGSVISALKEKNITLVEHFDHDLPMFLGSSSYLHITLKNILLNAIKHSSVDSEISFTIEKVEDQNAIAFNINDRGEGIPKEAQPYIFDSFFRADTARNRQLGGAGVGLSLALALTKLHNGSIELESEPGQGATFSVIIPQPKSVNVEDDAHSAISGITTMSEHEPLALT